MKSTIITRFIIINLVIISLFAISQAQEVRTIEASLTKDSKANKQKKAIENIVRDYILKNPELIREASQLLQLKEAKAKEEQIVANIKKFENEIYFDPNTPTNGNEKAEVSIVAFFDYNCGYCKSSLPTLKKLVAEDSSIRVVYKEYPIMGISSQLAAKAALAADRQGKYVEFHEALVSSEEITESSIKKIAATIGLNYDKLQIDMNDARTNEYLSNNYGLATALNIQGTPAYIIGTQFIPGAVDFESLKKIIAKEKAKITKRANIGSAK